MKKEIENFILQATAAKEITGVEDIQPLWAGHGVIQRISLVGGNYPSIILKDIDMSGEIKHPRGWNTNLSHQRKVKSYQVEIAWYQKWNHLNLVDTLSRTPKCIDSYNIDGEMFILLEDLNSSGFPERVEDATLIDLNICLKWLANFHAKFMNKAPEDLWESGTYWHLETRPDELKKIEGTKLHLLAESIDAKLNYSPFQTIVHGDAKIANFCFSTDRKTVSAVDFQYVGGGCGMKDVAYFVGSCLDESQCEEMEEEILDIYFTELKVALAKSNNQVDFKELESNWRELYHYAWTDFYRFLKGWSPGHWKINSYSDKVACKVISELEASK